MKPQTSVIIPCYNVQDYVQDYLLEALTSVKNQTAPIHEIILIDDGSRLPLRPPEGWDGPPLRLVRTANRGLPAARNLGITLATGRFVAFLDADDLWLPTKVEKQEQALEDRPGAVASFTQCVNTPGFFSFGPYPPEGVSDDEFLLVLWHYLFFPPSAVLARLDVVRKVGCFKEDLSGAEDIELWLRLMTRGSIVQVAEPLCGYRQHDQQFTQNICNKMFGSKQSRQAMIELHAERLVRAGLDRRKLWDAYRHDILLVYFRRQFAAARRLLWDYWLAHPGDLQMLKYALVSLLPERLVRQLKGQVTSPVGGEVPATRSSWELALRRIQHVLAGKRV